MDVDRITVYDEYDLLTQDNGDCINKFNLPFFPSVIDTDDCSLVKLDFYQIRLNFVVCYVCIDIFLFFCFSNHKIC